MRGTIVFLWLLTLPASGFGGVAKRPNWGAFRRHIVNPRALAESAGSAAIGQLRNSPHEWGQGIGGFARRFGSSVGTHVVKVGIEMGVGALHHENLHYQRSGRRGTLPRLEYAVKSTFIVPKTNRPGKTVALGRISGAVGAGLISRAWQPASTATLGAGLASGGIALAADVGFNVAREFWPRKHSKPEARTHRGR
jgi:hypothetical protein